MPQPPRRPIAPPEPTLADLESTLRINELALEQECRDQPSRLYAVSKRLALLLSQHDAAKQELKEVEADIADRMRQQAAAEESKISEASIASQLPLDLHVQEAANKLRDLKKQMGQYEVLKESFVDRSRALRNLVDLYCSNYYGSDLGRPRVNARAVNADVNRQEIARQRNAMVRR
jgi:hypothetical protein